MKEKFVFEHVPYTHTHTRTHMYLILKKRDMGRSDGAKLSVNLSDVSRSIFS